MSWMGSHNHISPIVCYCQWASPNSPCALRVCIVAKALKTSFHWEVFFWYSIYILVRTKLGDQDETLYTKSCTPIPE